MLYRSNKLMYDRATETLWRQFRGEPVVGPLAHSGARLKILPSVLTDWQTWLADHPDTTVISNQTGVYPPEFYRPESDSRSIYSSYRADPATMFPVPTQNDALPLKQRIFGLTFGNQARAYPHTTLSRTPTLNDTIGPQNLVIITLNNNTPRAYNRANLKFHLPNQPTPQNETPSSQASPQDEPSSNEARPQDEPSSNEANLQDKAASSEARLQNEPPLSEARLQDETGQQWQISETALINTANPSQRLDRLPSRDAYWFGWFAFYPHTEIYTP